MTPTLTRMLTGLLCLLAVGVCYLAFSTSGKVAVNEAGSVVGITNRARAVLQGKRFWVAQLREIDEVRRKMAEPKMLVELDKRSDRIFRETEEKVERIYRENPQLRPTESEAKAAALQREASEVELAEFRRLVDDARSKRLQVLHEARHAVEAEIRRRA
jgi:hypothetical protein